MKPSIVNGRTFLAAALLAFVALSGCSDRMADGVSAETLARELSGNPDLAGASGSNVIVSVRDGTAVVVRPGSRMSVQEIECQLGVALTNLAEKHGVGDLGFVAVEGGWEILGISEKGRKEKTR